MMAHEHGKDSHQYAAGSFRRLKFTLAIVLVIMVAEVLGGIFSGGLALKELAISGNYTFLIMMAIMTLSRIFYSG
jgi:hypothetical protein